MLITDQRQIAEAISQIIGEETYVSLRQADFDKLCPHPALQARPLLRPGG